VTVDAADRQEALMKAFVAARTAVHTAGGCPLLVAATRARWPLAPAGLPETRRPVIFGNHAGRVWPRLRAPVFRQGAQH
jgi:hypothetical protein